MHADWCLLLARTDPDAPKRKGISYFLLDMTTPGIDVRPIRNAIGDSHFCEIFLDDVRIPAANLIGAENAGWQVAQATLGRRARDDDARAGRTTRQRRLPAGWCESGAGRRPVVADRLAQFETEITGLRGLCRRLVEHEPASGPADASIVKLYYSELLQRLTDFGAEIGGLDAHTDGDQTHVQRMGVRLLGVGLRRFVGVDHPRRRQRDPAHHHRRARAWPAARAECGVMAHPNSRVPR